MVGAGHWRRPEVGVRRSSQLGTVVAGLAIALALVAAGASARSVRTMLLRITTDGVVVGSPGKLRCAGRCAIPVQAGTLVTLRALPRRHFTFSHWTGDCVGNSRTCTLVLDHRQSVQPVYDGQPQSVELTVGGPGLVTSGPKGLACGAGRDVCSAEFPWGTKLTLSARPRGGKFSGWGAACWNVGRGGCILTIRSETDVTASFAHAAPSTDPQTLTVQSPGERVTSKPAGIACPGTCQATFPAGTHVLLRTAAGGWGGDCVGDVGDRCPLVLDAPAKVVVIPPKYTPPAQNSSGYDVSVTVSGNGTVTAPGIHCGGTSGTLFDCESVYGPKAVVVLRARPRKRFARWSQFCSGTKTSCKLFVITPVYVGAAFRR